jgi:hypothetical protein
MSGAGNAEQAETTTPEIEGVIRELKKMPDHEAGMTILDLDEIQAAIGHCLYRKILRQGDAGAPASP